MSDDELTQKVCALLGAVEGWEWRPSGPDYVAVGLTPGENVIPTPTLPPGASEAGIFYGAIQSSPDCAIGVRVYQADDDVVTGLAIRRIQLRFRGTRRAPNGADILANAAFGVLQGLSRVEGISGIRRLSMAPLGADSNGREERTDNYMITIDNPEASL